MDPEKDRVEFEEIRERRDRLHTLRVAYSIRR
jgi:hypothetical protein